MTDLDALDPLLPELDAWRDLEATAPPRECPKWLEDLAEEHLRLEMLCREWRKPMTVDLELALEDAAERLRSEREAA